jgi:uncharacterized integral membrane protein (TIGR00697 family)
MDNSRNNNISQLGTRFLPVISGIFVASLLISNIIAQKLISVGPFTFTAGILLFPVSYIFGDCLTETYGYARARQVIWTGFAANILLSIFMEIAILWPAASGWKFQNEFAQIFSTVPRIVIASIIGYWVGEFSNSFVLAKMKLLTRGKYLWTRTIGSTIVGQAFDTIAFVLIAFSGNTPPGIMFSIIWSGYIFKVAYEVLATPLTYRVVGFLNKN